MCRDVSDALALKNHPSPNPDPTENKIASAFPPLFSWGRTQASSVRTPLGVP